MDVRRAVRLRARPGLLLVPVAAALLALAARWASGVAPPDRPETVDRRRETARTSFPVRAPTSPLPAATRATARAAEPREDVSGSSTLAGRVLWTDGVPFGPGLVFVHRLPDDGGAPRGCRSARFCSDGYRYHWDQAGDGRPEFAKVVELDEAGRFRIEGAPEGRYALTVDRWPLRGLGVRDGRIQDGTALRTEVRTGEAPGRFEIPTAGHLTVRVSGPGGQPAVRGAVGVASSRIYDLRAGVARIPFRFDGGAVRIEVRHARAASGEILGHRRTDPVPVASGEVALTLDPARPLTGRVVDEHGAPLPRARVRARPRWTRGKLVVPGETVARAKADAEGRFSLAGLGPHEYVLEVEHCVVDPERARCGPLDASITLRAFTGR